MNEAKEQMDTFLFFGSLILLVLGVVNIFSVRQKRQTYHNFSEKGVVTQGKITRKWMKRRRSGRTLHLKVSYTSSETKEEVTREKEFTVDTEMWKEKGKGESIEIIYHSHNPSHAFIKEDFDERINKGSYLLSFLMILLGIAAFKHLFFPSSSENE